MANSLNKVQLLGNSTREVELKTTQGGTSVATFSVATNLSFKNKAGEWEDRVEFHNVVAWGKLAENCANFLKKGNKVFVEGRLSSRSWEGKDGVKRYTTEVVAEDVIFLTPKPKTAPYQSSLPDNYRAELPETESVDSIDDLPF